VDTPEGVTLRVAVRETVALLIWDPLNEPVVQADKDGKKENVGELEWHADELADRHIVALGQFEAEEDTVGLEE
jgi:hypothetical protein